MSWPSRRSSSLSPFGSLPDQGPGTGYGYDYGHQQGTERRRSANYSLSHNSYTMGDHDGQARFGATFYPGGQDDFYMPELISPAPQRIMPEVPSNMQEGLATLELEARDTLGRRTSAVSSVSALSPPYDTTTFYQNPSTGLQAGSPRGYTANYEHTNASAYQNIYTHDVRNGHSNGNFGDERGPVPALQKTSIFPKLRTPGPNVPPTDEEKEEVLERARSLVLSSDDPEMQLAWAQDALSWVETATNYRLKTASDTHGRPATPEVEHQLRSDSLSIVNYLAAQEHPKALFLKATWHEFGKFGYPLDKHASLNLYIRSSKKGYSRSEYRIGTYYESIQDINQAISYYRQGVTFGDSASNYRLGMMALLGHHGQPQDYQYGLGLIQFAAATADENAPQGAYVYGMLLARELPNITIPDSILPVDIDKARQYIEKAAYLGFAKAQQKMGEAYELASLGAEFSPSLSLHYNALAARQGDPNAEMAISKWFLCGYQGLFAKNDEIAFQYAQRATAAELPTAEFAMGYFFESGTYVKQDLDAARHWYGKALEHGHKEAAVMLQNISQHKPLNKKDAEQTAINRIRSQYGSKHGARPDRLKERPLPLPTMSEPYDDPNVHQAQRVVSQPRPTSQQGPRSASAAPYPHDTNVPNLPRQNSLLPAAGPLADRPRSAFGLRPVHMTPDSGPNHQRVASSGWEQQAVAGVRQTSPTRHPVPAQTFQYPDQQDGRQSMQNGRLMPVGLQQPTNNGRQTSPNRKPPPPQSHQDGRQYAPAQHAPPPPQHGPVYPTTPIDGPAGRQPSASPGRPTGLPANPSANKIRPALPSNDARQSLPSLGGAQRQDPLQHSGRTSAPPARPQTTANSQGQPQNSSSAIPASSGNAAKPEKTGPKTFDEMGIPVGKTDGDCTVM